MTFVIKYRCYLISHSIYRLKCDIVTQEKFFVRQCNHATAPFGYCPKLFSLFGHIASDETDAKKILTVAPLENWRRPPGCPHTTWMKTIQHKLKSDNLSMNETIDVAQNRPLWHHALLVVHARNDEGISTKYIKLGHKLHNNVSAIWTSTEHRTWPAGADERSSGRWFFQCSQSWTLTTCSTNRPSHFTDHNQRCSFKQ